MSDSVVLQDADRFFVRARLSDDGGLAIEGHDLRHGEYEYFLTVSAEDVPLVARALGCQAVDLLRALERRGQEIVARGEKTWLEETGARVAFFSPS